RGTSNRSSQDTDRSHWAIVWIRNAGGQGIGVQRLTIHKCHGVNTLVPAVAAKSRYWGQGQQITASPTPGLVLNSSQSEIRSNSWRLGELAGVAAKSWMRTR